MSRYKRQPLGKLERLNFDMMVRLVQFPWPKDIHYRGKLVKVIYGKRAYPPEDRELIILRALRRFSLWIKRGKVCPTFIGIGRGRTWRQEDVRAFEATMPYLSAKQRQKYDEISGESNGS